MTAPYGSGYPQQPGPPFGGYQPPSPPNRTPLVIGLVVVVVVLVAAGLTVFFVLRGDDDPAPAAASATPTTAPTSSSSPAASMTLGTSMTRSTSTSTSRPSTPRPTAGDEGEMGLSDLEYSLYLAVPDAYLDCAHQDLPADGALAAITCSVGTDAGPATATFYGYPSYDVASSVYASDTSGVPALVGDCSTGQGATVFPQSNGQSAEVSCFISGSGDALIVWVDPLTSVEGILTLPAGGQTGLGQLADWWVQDQANLPNA